MAVVPTKRVAPAHKPWVPTGGQESAVDFLLRQPLGMLWADPGAGKTSITLTAISELLAAGEIKQALVLAPLRVAQLVWRAEAAKWDHLRHLRIGLLHGSKKNETLKNRDKYDILLCNYEGVDWLCDHFKHRQLPFDMVVADEVTRLKAHDGKRAKKLRRQTSQTPRKLGLTGTPVPNGLMDLFGQFLWMDSGATLGTYVTHWRDQYFVSDFNGWDYKLQSGAAERIEARIAPHVFRLPYEAMPAHDIPIEIEMPPEVRQQYREMKREMILELPEGVVTAANSAVVQQKLEQMANGAVYIRPGQPEYAVIHDLKLDALEDLIEGLNGQQLLVAYQFEHDLQRLQARFPNIPVLRGTEKVVQGLQDEWNAGQVRAMFVHPASVGHGLNLQLSSAKFICWFSATFNLEHWDQLIRRLRRQGSEADKITNYILAVKGTVDELKLEVLGDKDSTQARLLQGLADHLEDGSGGEDHTRASERGAALSSPVREHDVPTAIHGGRSEPAAEPTRLHRAKEGGSGRGLQADSQRPVTAGSHPTQAQRQQGADHMSTGFKRLSQTAPAEAAPAPAERVQPKGWGKPAGNAAAPPAQQEAQREAIRTRVSPATLPAETTREAVATDAPETEQPPARSHFSRGVQAQLGGEPDPKADPGDTGVTTPAKDETAKPAPRARRSTAPADKIADAAADVAGVDRVNYAGNAANGVSISLYGLPPTAVKAALQAIANTL